MNQLHLSAAALTYVLIITATIQLSVSSFARHPLRECRNKESYFETYDTIHPGLKMLDALGAQNDFFLFSDVSLTNLNNQ